MRTCNHSHWLGLYERGNEITFTHSDRAQVLFHSLPYFESQKPTLFVLVGNVSKVRALKELASASTQKKTIGQRQYGEIHLHVDPSTIFSDRPVFFAEGDFSVLQKPNKVVPINKCHGTTQRTLSGLRGSIPSNHLQIAADSLYFQLLSPFTDVFCFFAADLGGLKPIALRIASWLNTGQPSTLPASTHSQIIIVTESMTSDFQEPRILDEFLQLLSLETSTDPLTFFASIRILALLPNGDISPTSRYRKLKETLLDASDYVRSARLESRVLFSSQHFAAFLSHACSHFAASSKEPFSFIKTSRIDNPPAPDLSERLIRFLRKIKTLLELKNFAIPHIASCLLLDNYPPDMHCK
jgi:hypothetical protein